MVIEDSTSDNVVAFLTVCLQTRLLPLLLRRFSDLLRASSDGVVSSVCCRSSFASQPQPRPPRTYHETTVNKLQHDLARICRCCYSSSRCTRDHRH